MPIKIVKTSNPKIQKFEGEEFLTQHQSLEFSNIDEAINAPLVAELFHFPFVKKVYVSLNFIAIERFDIVTWEEVENDIAEFIASAIERGIEVIKAAPNKPAPVTVYAESTPNPAVLKFVANKKLVENTVEFKSIDEARSAPLATALFHLPFVKSVFFDENFVSITKYDVADWNEVTLEVREFIRSYLAEGKPILEELQVQEAFGTPKDESIPEVLDDVSASIVSILDEYIKPAVAGDGGNIQFSSYNADTKEVQVILQGACSGCPSSTMTLKNGIESLLQEMLKDKVSRVIAING
jgi:NFU1 iron-sulfur cluster scaffold homolog, mitochondrial